MRCHRLIDPVRIQADQHARAFFHGSGLAALADADAPPFGLDHHDVGGLVDHRLTLASLGIAGITEIADCFDLVLRQGERIRGGSDPQASRERTKALQEATTILRAWLHHPSSTRRSFVAQLSLLVQARDGIGHRILLAISRR